MKNTLRLIWIMTICCLFLATLNQGVNEFLSNGTRQQTMFSTYFDQLLVHFMGTILLFWQVLILVAVAVGVYWIHLLYLGNTDDSHPQIP